MFHVELFHVLVFFLKIIWSKKDFFNLREIKNERQVEKDKGGWWRFRLNYLFNYPFRIHSEPNSENTEASPVV